MGSSKVVQLLWIMLEDIPPPKIISHFLTLRCQVRYFQLLYTWDTEDIKTETYITFLLILFSYSIEK